MIKRFIVPAVAVMLFSGCVSTEKKEAIELNNRRLIQSLQYPGTARLKYTLDRGADPNFKDQYGVPALIKAVALKQIDHVKMLLARGANVNAVDPDGETAVFAAASTGNVALLELLVKHGAALNIRGKNGKTPAMDAARLGHLEMLKYLLDKGADINAVDKNTAGLAAYAVSSEKNGIAILAFLEKKGLRVDLENTSLLGSPFLRALFFDQVKTALALLPKMQNFDANPRMMKIGRLAAYYAISHNRIELLKAMIKKKLPLNHNEPIYYHIVKQVNVTGIYKLAARNDIIEKRYTPLMYACIFGRVEMVALLIESGANPLIESNEGRIAEDYSKDRDTYRVASKATKEWRQKYLQGKRKPTLEIRKDTGIKRATVFDIKN